MVLLNSHNIFHKINVLLHAVFYLINKDSRGELGWNGVQYKKPKKKKGKRTKKKMEWKLEKS